MQSLHKTDYKLPLKPGSASVSTAEPIATHRGWQISLTYIAASRFGKGWWLHWCHPQDQDRQDVIKCGQFIGPDQTLQDALHLVYQAIEASIELEILNPAELYSQAISQPEETWSRDLQMVPG